MLKLDPSFGRCKHIVKGTSDTILLGLDWCLTEIDQKSMEIISHIDMKGD